MYRTLRPSPAACIASPIRRMLVLLSVMLTLAPLSTAVAAVDAYPGKPVRLIIPFAPGGITDIIGRVVALKLTDRLGTQIVVENRGGAGGIIGMEMVAKAKPDGYTLLFTTAAFATNPSLYKVPFDPVKSFAPIARVGVGVNVLTVHPGVQVNSVKELIALAKKQPGKLACSAAGAGSFGHLAIEYFKSMAGVDFKIVQFKGGGPAAIDTIGGHSQIHFSALSTTLPHIRSGKLKALGISGSARSRLFPDLPTIAEAGVPGYEASIWLGLLAPAGTPKPVIEKIHKDLAAVLASDEGRKGLENQGVEVDLAGPAEFGKFIEAEIAKWGKVVKESNIKMDD
ncbi:MAG: tripartite tricarboxylate transporter substrate binding protein [Thermodesulfobacteriota bacterium]